MAKNLGGAIIDLLDSDKVDLRVAAATVLAAVGRSDKKDKTVQNALTERLESGRFGMKTGEGFFKWTPESIAAERRRYDDMLRAGLRLLAAELPPIDDR